MATQQTARTRYVTHEDGTKFAYRTLGATTGTPLLFLMHFRGTIDHWDPILINTIAAERNVILYDYPGVGFSTPGVVKSTISEMAADVYKFLSLIDVNKVDILGFSIGGMVAQLIALNANTEALEVRKLVLCGTCSSAGPGTQTTPNEAGVVTHAGAKQVSLSDVAVLFFPSSKEGMSAAEGYWNRIHERQVACSGEDRVQYLSHDFLDEGDGMTKMLAALTKFSDPKTSQGHNGSYSRLSELKMPILIANGHVSCTLGSSVCSSCTNILFFQGRLHASDFQ
jgi:pimeloyl-ACP methyl ester carboxylesterase